MYWEIDAERENSRTGDATDDFPEKLLNETDRNVILEDKERWNGASVDQIREDFKQYLASIGVDAGSIVPRYTVCLIIDEKCLKSIMAAVEPEDQDTGGPRMGVVTMVDPTYNPNDNYDNAGYRGFMRVEINELWWVTFQLSAFLISEICPRIARGKIPVYNGHYGFADDE